MLQHQLILGQVAPLILKPLLTEPLGLIHLIEELESLQMERGTLLILLQNHHLRVHEFAVPVDMGLHESVEFLEVGLGEGDLEGGLVPAQLLLGLGLRQGVQLLQELGFVVLLAQVAQQLDTLLHVLHVDVLVHVQQLTGFGDFQDLGFGVLHLWAGRMLRVAAGEGFGLLGRGVQ